MTSNPHVKVGTRVLSDEACKISGAVFKLLRRKRELTGGRARPCNGSELRRWWKILMDTFENGNRSEMDAALRLMREELRLEENYTKEQHEIVAMFVALLVYEDL